MAGIGELRRIKYAGRSLAICVVLTITAFVIVGWTLQLPALIRLFPMSVPMQPSTALALFFLALAVSRRRLRYSLPLVALPLVLATLSFLQYPLEFSLGIEQGLLRVFAADLSIEPTQMAPNTSIAIAFLSTAFLLAFGGGEKSRIASGCLALFALCLGVSSQAGYVVDLGSFSRLGNFPAMAPHSALCISILAILHSLTIHSSFKDTFPRSRNWQISAALSLGIGFSFTLWWIASSAEYAKIRAALIRVGKVRATLIEHQFETDVERLKNVERLIATAQSIETELFKRFTKNLITPGSAILGIDWAPRTLAERPNGTTISFPVLYAEGGGDTAKVRGSEEYSQFNFEMERAASSGAARATSLYRSGRLQSWTSRPEDFLTVVPVFTSDEYNRVDSILDNRLRGFVIGSFRLSRLVTSAFVTLQPNGPALEIFPANNTESEPLLTFEQPAAFDEDWFRSPMFPSLVSAEEIDLAGQKFSLIFRPSQTFFDRERSALPLCALIASLVFVTVLILYLRSLFRKNDVIQAATEKAHKAVAEVMSYRAALDEHTIVAMTDRSGRIIEANELFCKISEYSREELIGRTHSIVNSGYHPKSFFLELWRTIASGKIWRGEICNRAKSGRLYWVNTIIVPVMGGDGRPEAYIVARNDITDMKLYQATLREAKEAAESAARVKSEFLARMSHEIRTPLTAILGFAEQIVGSRDDVERDEAGQIVLRNSQHLLDVVNDILDFSKIEAGRLFANPEPTDLRDIIKDIDSTFRSLANQKGLDFRIVTDAKIPRFIRTDPLRLKQILLNIVGNAVKFTDRGSVSMEICLIEGQERISFHVADSGIGIPEEQRSSLFRDFSQLDSSTTKRFGGTGLGLAISKQLAELLGGDIKVESRPGLGSTFTLTIPCEKANPVLSVATEENVSRSRSGSGSETSTSKTRVLIVDDGADNRRLQRYLLKKLGFDVSVAGNGERAISMALGGNFSLVVMDMHMPGLDGYTATERLRAMGYRVPIVACTADATEANRERLKAVGCDDLILKPFTTDRFIRTIRRILSGAHDDCTIDRQDPVLAKLETKFVRELPQRLAEIRQAQAKGDYDEVARLAHKLAGASAFGLASLSEISNEIVQSAREHDVTRTTDLLARVDSRCTEILASLSGKFV